MRCTPALAGLGWLLVASVGAAQKTIVSSAGWIFRYHGDTIWVEHDSAAATAIFHGDTVDRIELLNDRPRLSMSYVLRGDSAYILGIRGTDGQANDLPTTRALPALIALMERQMLENALREAEVRSRVPIASLDRFDPPDRPDAARSYDVSRNVTILQHRDTVRYITGCAAIGHADTTTFLLFGRDSVRRVSPSPRMFGRAMALSLISHMRSANLRQYVASNAGDFSHELPPIPDPCKGAK